MTSGKSLAGTAANTNGVQMSGGSFNLTNNSSLIGFKGTEDLGNGLKGMFQIETNVNLTGGSSVAVGSQGTTFGSMRDSYVGLGSKYGTVMGGFLSTPYRSALNSFDVMPGATGSGRIENIMGKVRLNTTNLGGAVNTGYLQADSSVRATALAYALPTMYGINGSIAYTGNAQNGNGNMGTLTVPTTSGANAAVESGIAANLGWEGYGFGIKGAYQQAKVNYAQSAANNFQGYTSFLVGAQYTGVPGLKAAVVYGRNSLGTNATGTQGAQKASNNQIYAGVSYRFGNNEPRLSYVNSGNTSGLNNVGQDGGNQWTANWGYYLSKRTQVYGLVSAVNNNANGVWNVAGSGSNLAPTGGQAILTYGAGMRTNF